MYFVWRSGHIQTQKAEENLPDKVKDKSLLPHKHKPETSLSAVPGASVQNNNCTLNVYGAGSTPSFPPPEIVQPSKYFSPFQQLQRIFSSTSSNILSFRISYLYNPPMLISLVY